MSQNATFNHITSGDNFSKFLSLVEDLVIQRNPISTIWNKMIDEWKSVKDKDQYKNLYRKTERKIYFMEDLISRLYPEIYDILIRTIQSNQHPISYYFQEGSKILIILDGLSIREYFVIKNELYHKNYIEKYMTYQYSALPSDTRCFVERLFGVFSYPSTLTGRKKNGVNFLFVKNKNDIPIFPGTPLLVWIPFPDSIIDHEIESYEKIIEKTLEVLNSVINQYNIKEFILTSDHGYISNAYISSDNWLREKFGGKRSILIQNSLNDAKHDHKLIKTDDSLCIKGRLCGIPRNSKAMGGHGGCSFTEVLTPFANFIRKT